MAALSCGFLRKLTQFGERVTLFLFVSKLVREIGNDAPGQGYVPGLYRYICGFGECFYYR